MYPLKQSNFIIRKAKLRLQKLSSVGKDNKKVIIKNDNDVFNFIKPLFTNIEIYEEVFLIGFDTESSVSIVYKISQGGFTSSSIDIKMLFTVLLTSKCNGFIMVHNHPSGVLSPSDQDKTMCSRLMSAAKFLDMNMLDFIIISNDDYYSFNRNNEMK